METEREKERGESWPDQIGIFNLAFSFTSIFDRIKRYLAKRKLRKILKNRNEITRARIQRNKL
jgi:hypothetical protein